MSRNVLLLNELNGITNKILLCGNQIGIMYEAVHEMYNIYCKLTSVDINNMNEEEIVLPSGKAISPSAAAHCLLEMVRTTKFLRGINKAIEDKLKTKQQIRILYAGCGPYATLITPLLTLPYCDNLSIDLLDINDTSLNSAKKVLTTLSLDNYVEDYYLDDATTFNSNKNYDLVISETLSLALRNEPFVAIYQNIVPQMDDKCVFIPEEVVVGLKSNTLKNEKKAIVDYGEILKINKKTVLAPIICRNIEICNTPDSNQPIEYKLYTDVAVYKNEILTEGECSLNLPFKILELRKKEELELNFRYNQQPPVEIEFTINETVLQ